MDSGSKCKATVGFNRGRARYLKLHPNHCNQRDIFHEVFHVMGLLHEHQRPDRDNYVEIHWANVPWALDQQFRIRHNSDTLGLPYDATSILHYSSQQGSPTPGLTTISSKVNYLQFSLKNNSPAITGRPFIQICDLIKIPNHIKESRLFIGPIISILR